jgi:hypothetical protein
MLAPSDVALAHGGGAVWPHFANMTLGLWLIAGASALRYPSAALQVSDVASGALVILLAALSLSSRPFWKLWAPWANSLVGLWLLFAPLVFWAPTAAAYSNDTLVGALVVVFAILAPGMPMAPGMSMEPGPDVPPGWSYNPSSWPQRAPWARPPTAATTGRSSTRTAAGSAMSPTPSQSRSRGRPATGAPPRRSTCASGSWRPRAARRSSTND